MTREDVYWQLDLEDPILFALKRMGRQPYLAEVARRTGKTTLTCVSVVSDLTFAKSILVRTSCRDSANIIHSTINDMLKKLDLPIVRSCKTPEFYIQLGNTGYCKISFSEHGEVGVSVDKVYEDELELRSDSSKDTSSRIFTASSLNK